MKIINHLRNWAYREPVYFHQLVAIVASLVAFGVNKAIGTDTTDASQLSAGIYALLSIFGVVVARNKVDGPETADSNALHIVHQDIKLQEARELLDFARMYPDKRTEVRAKINDFLADR